MFINKLWKLHRRHWKLFLLKFFTHIFIWIEANKIFLEIVTSVFVAKNYIYLYKDKIRTHINNNWIWTVFISKSFVIAMIDELYISVIDIVKLNSVRLYFMIDYSYNIFMIVLFKHLRRCIKCRTENSQK